MNIHHVLPFFWLGGMDGVDGLLFSFYFCLQAVVIVAVVSVIGVFPRWLIGRVLIFFQERLFDGIGQFAVPSPAPLAQWQLAFRKQFPNLGQLVQDGITYVMWTDGEPMILCYIGLHCNTLDVVHGVRVDFFEKLISNLDCCSREKHGSGVVHLERAFWRWLFDGVQHHRGCDGNQAERTRLRRQRWQP